MSNPAPFEPIGELLQRSVSIKHVYGEPVRHGDTTVIPVATVAFGFGAGGGRGRRRGHPATDQNDPANDGSREGQGGGGGGGVRMTPVGALEIGPEGTRFIRLHPVAPPLIGAALGLALGWLLVRRAR